MHTHTHTHISFVQNRSGTFSNDVWRWLHGVTGEGKERAGWEDKVLWGQMKTDRTMFYIKSSETGLQGKKKKRSEAKDNHGHRLNSFPRMNQSELTWSDFLTSLQGLWAFGDRKAAYKCSKAVWVNTSQFGNNDLSSMMKLSMKYGWEYGNDWTSQNCIANVANEIFLDLIPNSWPRAVLFYFCSVLQFLKNACKSQSSA